MDRSKREQERGGRVWSKRGDMKMIVDKKRDDVRRHQDMQQHHTHDIVV